jgi:diaminopimelate epimerase
MELNPLMEFTKMHGAANDFVVVDARCMERDWPRMAITVCDRHRGIGCDSLITLLSSNKADFAMRTYDTDGSESETCGNGLRCIARYVLEKGLVKPDAVQVTIETLSEVSTVKYERQNGKVVKLWANLGRPRLAMEQIPINPEADGKGEFFKVNSLIDYRGRFGDMELTLNLVSMGNPHAVFFTEQPVAEFPMEKIGPLVENYPIFPKRTNFQVARVLDEDHIEARVWEKGVGETQACGSGTCAITVASKLNGYTGSKVQVRLPGGTLDASFNGSGEVVLGGPAVIVYEGIWPE